MCYLYYIVESHNSRKRFLWASVIPNDIRFSSLRASRNGKNVQNSKWQIHCLSEKLILFQTEKDSP